MIIIYIVFAFYGWDAINTCLFCKEVFSLNQFMYGIKGLYYSKLYKKIHAPTETVMTCDINIVNNGLLYVNFFILKDISRSFSFLLFVQVWADKH